MNVGDMENKLRKGSVQRKKTKKDFDELRKIIILSYNCFAGFARACEATEQTRLRIAYAKTLTLPTARKAPEHLDRAIIAAESYSERDLLYRRLASQCYKTSQWFTKNGDYKQASKWMNLALRFLRLSLDPKAKEDLEIIKKEVAELKAAMQEREEEEEDEEDGED
jgi:hypothetical protein